MDMRTYSVRGQLPDGRTSRMFDYAVDDAGNEYLVSKIGKNKIAISKEDLERQIGRYKAIEKSLDKGISGKPRMTRSARDMHDAR